MAINISLGASSQGKR
jgi:hypothetical protein